MTATFAKQAAYPYQDPHAGRARGMLLEQAIGREVRRQREKLDVTISELAKAAGISAGMLSKIENGATSPSLSSLHALAQALQVPLTTFFRHFDEMRTATFVKAGQGLAIEDSPDNAEAITVGLFRASPKMCHPRSGHYVRGS